MVAGADTIKIHGAYVPVRAEVANLAMLSAHADADEILRWLRRFRSAAAPTFITHGEPAAADALRLRIEEELGWACMVPEHGQKAELVMSTAPAPAIPCPDRTRLRARRLGIDTHYEAVVFMHKDCHVCRSEGFDAHTRVLLRAGDTPRHRHALSRDRRLSIDAGRGRAVGSGLGRGSAWRRAIDCSRSRTPSPWSRSAFCAAVSTATR